VKRSAGWGTLNFGREKRTQRASWSACNSCTEQQQQLKKRKQQYNTMSDDSSDDQIVKRPSSSKRRRTAVVLSEEEASASDTDDEPIVKRKTSSSKKRMQFVDSDGDEIGTLSETPPEPYRNLSAALKAAVPHSQLSPDEERPGSNGVLDVTDSADEGDINEQAPVAKPAVHCSSEEEAEFDAAAADDERETEFDDAVTPLAANSSSSNSSKRRASALKQPRTPAIAGRFWGSSGTGTTPSLTASGRPLRAAAASAIKQGAYSTMLGGGLSDGEDSSADATNGAATTAAAAATTAAAADSDNESVDSELEAALRLSAASAVKTKPATAAAASSKGIGKAKSKGRGKGRAAKQSTTDTVDLVSPLLLLLDICSSNFFSCVVKTQSELEYSLHEKYTTSL
jgi:hypothetical protein